MGSGWKDQKKQKLIVSVSHSAAGQCNIAAPQPKVLSTHAIRTQPSISSKQGTSQQRAARVTHLFLPSQCLIYSEDIQLYVGFVSRNVGPNVRCSNIVLWLWLCFCFFLVFALAFQHLKASLYLYLPDNLMRAVTHVGHYWLLQLQVDCWRTNWGKRGLDVFVATTRWQHNSKNFQPCIAPLLFD